MLAGEAFAADATVLPGGATGEAFGCVAAPTVRIAVGAFIAQAFQGNPVVTSDDREQH